MRHCSYFSSDLFRREAPSQTLSLAKTAGETERAVVPALTARDEAIFWLTAAAEVEHFLMVHYLFAAYSLDDRLATGQEDKAERLRKTLLQIAREEMGHLITVQNLLTLIGAPLNFRREHSPYASEVYPFRFKLERVSAGSLAKYTLAESPINRDELEEGLTAEDLALFDTEIRPAAEASNDGQSVRNVGPIFARLYQLFATELTDEDFRLDRADRQARWSDWGYRRRPFEFEPKDLKVIVHHFDQSDVAGARAAAVAAIEEIGEQGEAADLGIGDGESHFERFLDAYKILASIEAEGVSPVLPVLANPNVTRSSTDTSGRSMVEVMQEVLLEEGRITNTRSRAWGQLFNLRYRLLLRYLHHAMLSSESVYLETGPDAGDRTSKGLLIYWTFKEMRRLSKIARKLVKLPSGQQNLTAGPPFELPYTLNLPTDDTDRWAGHVDVMKASESLIKEILAGGDDKDDPFLLYLLEDDAIAQRIADALAEGQTVPEDANPSAFKKVAAILDEAVRGFPLGVHGGFWRDVKLERFLEPVFFGRPIVIPGESAEDSEVFRLISLPEEDGGRMPRFRPRIDQSRLDFIRGWIEAGAPDNNPAGQIGVKSEPDPAPEAAPDQPKPVPEPGFEADIKPLFRETPDRVSMLFLFDLHKYDDVKTNAEAILASLESGRMPCTMAWPEERVAMFRAWMDADFPA